MLVEFTAHTHNMNVPVVNCLPGVAFQVGITLHVVSMGSCMTGTEAPLTDFVEMYVGPPHTTGIGFELSVNTPVGSLLNKV
jgi:hypothetical protein